MANTEDPGGVKSELQALYDDIEEAFIRKDASAIERVIAPEFEADMPDGTHMDHDVLMANIRRLFEDDPQSWTRQVTSVRTEGDRVYAIAEGVYKTRKSDGSMVEEELRNEDVWMRSDSGWKLISAIPLEGKL